MDATLKGDVSRTAPHLLCVTTDKFAVDYNSWVESDKGRRLANSLDKDVVLAEGSLAAPDTDTSVAAKLVL